MRIASPSATAVLPTPGSPMRHGLFFWRRFKIWITRSVSCSRPMMRSSLPSRALPVRSSQYISRYFLFFFSLSFLCALVLFFFSVRKNGNGNAGGSAPSSSPPFSVSSSRSASSASSSSISGPAGMSALRSSSELISEDSISSASSLSPICSIIWSRGLIPSVRAHLRHRPSCVALSPLPGSIFVMNITATFLPQREHMGICMVNSPYITGK